MRGRMVRGGRVVARVLLVWLVSVLALRLLDAWLPGFAMPQWWQPTVIALAFGVLVRRRVAADRAGRAAGRRLHAGHRLVPADGRGAARPLVRDPGRR